MRWALACLLIPGLAFGQAEVVSEDIAEIAVTVYPDNLALITETRRVDVTAGRSQVSFRGVSDLMIPQSVVLRSFEGVTLERNFDYDLLSRTSLFENSIGDTIRLTRINRDTGQTLSQDAEVVAADASNGVIVRTEEGYEGLYCSGLAVREGFDGLPPGLAALPTLSIEVEAETAGERELTISYLTSGFDWEADYRFDIKDEGTGDLRGWLSLQNGTATTYADADLSVLAGEVERDEATVGVDVYAQPLFAACYPLGSTKDGILVEELLEMADGAMPAPMAAMAESSFFEEDEIIVTGSRIAKAVREDLGDYKLYKVPFPVTLAAYQDKQVAFLSETDVPHGREHRLDFDDMDEWTREGPVALETEYVIGGEDGLEEPLPKGNVRLFGSTPGQATAFLGEDDIEDTPAGEAIRVSAGESAFLFYTSDYDTEGNSDRTRVSAEFTNASDVEEVLYLQIYRDIKPRVRGMQRVERDKDVEIWKLDLEPNSKAGVSIRYTDD